MMCGLASITMASFFRVGQCHHTLVAHDDIAQPWAFLNKLAIVMLARPHIIHSWNQSEQNEIAQGK